MKKINIIIQGSKKLNYGAQAVAVGYVDTKNQPTIKQMIQKELKDKYKDIKSFDEKINFLFREASESPVKEMLFLDLQSKSFKNLLDQVQNSNKNEVKMTNVTMVFKNEKPKEKWGGFNSVAFFTDLTILKEGANDWKVFFYLNRIEFLRMNAQRKQPSMDLHGYTIENTKNIKSVESYQAQKMKGWALSDEIFKNYRKIVDIFDNRDSRLDLKKNSEFIFSFLRFLEEKKRESIPLFSFKTFSSDLDENIILYGLFSERNINLLKGVKSVSISNGMDTSSKFQAKIEKHSKFDHEKHFSNHIRELAKDIEIKTSQIHELRAKAKEIKKQISTNEKSLEKQSIENDSLKSQRISPIHDEVKQHEYKKASLNKEYKKIEKEYKILVTKNKIKTTKKNAKSSKKADAKTIEKLENDIKKYETEMKEVKKTLSTVEIQLTAKKKQHKSFLILAKENDVKISSLIEDIKGLSKSLKDCIISETPLIKAIRSNQNEIASCENQMEFIKEKKLEIKKIHLSYKHKDGENRPDFYIEKLVDIQKIIENMEQLWVLSTFDFGLYTNFKRFSNNIRNLKEGHYKNPYLALALDKPSKFKSNFKIEGKYDLNEKQRSAVDKALSTDDIAYIQGPPGTGKTQTIAAVANEIINKKGNVLISSSTHAAIDNFFERLDSQEKRNPNIFMLKYNYAKRPSNYDENNMFNRFLGSLDANILNVEGGQNFDKLIEEVKEFDETYVKRHRFHSSNLSEYLLSNLKSKKSKINDVLDDIYGLDLEDDLEDIIYEIKELDEILLARKKYNPWRILISKIAEATNQQKLFIYDKKSAIKFLESKQPKTKESEFKNSYSKFIKFRNKINNSYEEKEFKKVISKNDMVNAIGITTTSRKSFDFNGKTNKIFTEYPIECVIIDEVSKSVTPEIISNSFLAKKVLLTGDYRQLPPVNNIEQNLLKQFFNSKYSQRFDKDYFNSKDEDAFVENINDMFSNSLFKNQIKSIKEETTAKAYEFLNTQYRFTKDIMDAVNISYDEDEALKMPPLSQQRQWMDVRYKTNSGIQKKSFNVVDTSYISKGFIEKINSSKLSSKIVEKIKENDSSFDQKSSIFFKNLHKNSRFNEYNAFVIQKLVESILVENKAVKESQIGVISMTRSQATIIKNELERANIKNVKVDTVDNFQGSERDIIIVDLVRAKGSFEKGGSKYSLNYPKKRILDFYKRIERLNVAISRGRSKLIIVGAIENHLGPEVISTVEVNGKKENKRVMQEFKDRAYRNGGYKSWT